MICDDIQKKRVDDDSNNEVFDDFHRHDLLYKSFCLVHRAVGVFRLVPPCIVTCPFFSSLLRLF